MVVGLQCFIACSLISFVVNLEYCNWTKILAQHIAVRIIMLSLYFWMTKLRNFIEHEIRSRQFVYNLFLNTLLPEGNRSCRFIV